MISPTYLTDKIKTSIIHSKEIVVTIIHCMYNKYIKTFPCNILDMLEERDLAYSPSRNPYIVSVFIRTGCDNLLIVFLQDKKHWYRIPLIKYHGSRQHEQYKAPRLHKLRYF